MDILVKNTTSVIMLFLEKKFMLFLIIILWRQIYLYSSLGDYIILRM